MGTEPIVDADEVESVDTPSPTAMLTPQQTADLISEYDRENVELRATLRAKNVLLLGAQRSVAALEAQVRELGAQPVTDPTPRRVRRATAKKAGKTESNGTTKKRVR